MAETPEPVEEKASEGGSVNRGKTLELINKIFIYNSHAAYLRIIQILKSIQKYV